MRIACSGGIAVLVWTVAALLPLFVAAPASAVEAQAGDDVAAYRRAVETRFSVWLTALWPDAQAASVSRATFDANLKALKLNWSLPHLVLPDPAAPGGPPLPPALEQAVQPQRQPEFDAPECYFKDGTLTGLAAQGRAKTAEWRPQLAEIEKRYGVPASIVVAIWGRETGFGKIDAPYDALAAIATQGFMGRRPEEFRKQLIVALKILGEGHATRGADEKLMGRRHGLYPVHAHGFRELCGGFRRRRQARHLGLDRRFARLDRQFAARRKAGTAPSPGATRCACQKASIAPCKGRTRRGPSANG